MKLIKSQENVSEFGEVFTPRNIVNDMLNQIPNEYYSDPNYVFLEPTCGNGNFIVEVFLKKTKGGLNIEQSINTIFGLDICPENIKECHNRLYKGIHILIGSNWKRWIDIICIIRNNIFVVNDSISFMQNEWENYPFFNVSPTNQQIRPLEEQQVIQKQIKKEIYNFVKDNGLDQPFQE